jgi:tripartite-type tricarboxylate transporter receptor subunit TctC
VKPASVSILGSILCAALAASAQAQPAAQAGQGTFPTKAVRIVVPFPAGGVLDRLTRTLGQKLSEAWGQPVIVDDKPGAGTVIGTDVVAHAAADGHTLLMMAVSFVINPSLRPKLPYAIDRDFTPVMQIASTPNVLVVNNAVPATDLQQLLALARAKPGQLAFASSGAGTPQHLAGEQLKQVAKVDLIHVPYQGGGPVVTALLAGQVAMTIVNLAEVQSYVDSGRMRMLAVATARRVEGYPGVPTMAEAGVPGFDSTSWFGLVAPAGTPPAIIEKIHADIGRILQMPDVKASLKAQGLTIIGDSPEQFGAFMKRERESYAQVIKAGNIQVD